MNKNITHLDAFAHSLVTEYILLALGHVEQLLLASKSVPYNPKLSLMTLFYGTSFHPV